MSNQRKLKRVQVNGVRRHAKQGIVNFPLTPERDRLIDLQKDKEAGKAIFLKWKQRFINTPIHPADIPQAFNELAAELDQKLKLPEMKKWIIEELIYPAIMKSHMLTEFLDKNTVIVEGLCSCGLMGKGEVQQRYWLVRQFHLVCPDCEQKIPGTDCYLASNKEKPKKKKR